MDLHPIIVHFPIAILTLWSLIEIVRPSRLLPQVSWASISAFLLVTGFLTALAALFTGDIAAGGIPSALTGMHEQFAQLSVILYGLFVLDFVFPFVLRMLVQIFSTSFYGGVVRIVRMYERLFQMRMVRLMLASIALASLVVTGMLGGVMVYGPDIDPLAPFILSVLGLAV